LDVYVAIHKKVRHVDLDPGILFGNVEEWELEKGE
jgi:hypothetical protein